MNRFFILISAFSFIAYGLACFCSARMIAEFQRYQLSLQRRWIGSLQIAGGLGLLAGLMWPGLGRAAAIGLAIMMLLAVQVRYKIKDNLLQTTPAVFYFALNTYLAISGF